MDEIQTGFGRTGTLFGFEGQQVIPDIFTIAKGMGGGLPIGAFVAPKKIMAVLKSNPILGHITTFGGHPLSAAASLATLKTIMDEKIIESIPAKSALIRDMLQHPTIKELRGLGLMFAMELENGMLVKKVITRALELGVITDWFLFCPEAIRIAPPLIISATELEKACEVLLKSLKTL